jgi:hypothetical protein
MNFPASSESGGRRIERRESEHKGRAVIEFTFGADGSVMGEDDVLGNCEAQACASGLPGARLVDAVKALEQSRQMFGGDAGTEIADIELDGETPPRRGPQG